MRTREKACGEDSRLIGFAAVQLDVTVMNVALERIGGIAGLQCLVNAYTVVFASLILTSGALGDRLGAKRLFIAGFVLFSSPRWRAGRRRAFSAQAIQGF